MQPRLDENGLAVVDDTYGPCSPTVTIVDWRTDIFEVREWFFSLVTWVNRKGIQGFRLCAAIVDRLTFDGHITDQRRLLPSRPHLAHRG